MKRYILTGFDEDKEIIIGNFKTLKEAQKVARDGQYIYEVCGYWNARPAMELDKRSLEEIA